MATLRSKLINPFENKYQAVFSARFHKQDEDGQNLHENGFNKNLNSNQKITERDFENIDTISPLEHQYRKRQMKDGEWPFDKINSMTVFFYKTVKLQKVHYKM